MLARVVGRAQLRSCAAPLRRSLPCPAVARRLCTPAEAPAEEAKPASFIGGDEEKLIYTGGQNKAVVMLKKVSIANLGFAVASTPVLQYITQATGQGGKGAVMSGLLVGMGGATTGGLAWATSTYALNIYSVPGKQAIRIETPTLLGGIESTEVLVADIGRPQGYHPFATFQAGGDKYYIDELGELHDPTFTEMLEEKINS